MRFAYLIMAHDSMEQLKILLHLLDHEENDIYLHIEPFPISRTRKGEKKLSEFMNMPMSDQAASEARRRASKRSGEIHPKAECGRTVL